MRQDSGTTETCVLIAHRCWKVTAFHPNFTKLNDFVVDDKPNDIKGSSTYFNFQARVHAMIEIFSQVRQLFFFFRLYFFQPSKNFHFIRKFLHGDLVRYTLKVREVWRNFATTTKPSFYPRNNLGVIIGCMTCRPVPSLKQTDHGWTPVMEYRHRMSLTASRFTVRKIASSNLGLGDTLHWPWVYGLLFRLSVQILQIMLKGPIHPKLNCAV